VKIPITIRSFPGSDQERLDLLAAVRRNCGCKGVPGSISVIEESCGAHALLADSSMLKQLVFQRRWRRSKR
jgi:hypothetical protein